MAQSQWRGTRDPCLGHSRGPVGGNILKNIVGVGMLGLPFALSRMGLVGFLFMAYAAGGRPAVPPKG